MSTSKVASIEPLNTGSSITLNTNSQIRVLIENTGRVGVGEPYPLTLLSVGGNTQVDGTLTVGGNTIFDIVGASGLLNCATLPTSGDHLCNKTYVDATLYELLPTVVITQTITHTATLALTSGTWYCECYGGNFQSNNLAYDISINGSVVVKNTMASSYEGSMYTPVAAAKTITLTAATNVVFTALEVGSQYPTTGGIMVCKATKIA